MLILKPENAKPINTFNKSSMIPNSPSPMCYCTPEKRSKIVNDPATTTTTTTSNNNNNDDDNNNFTYTQKLK